GKCLVVDTTPASTYPVTAAVTVRAATSGSEEGERLPMVTSAEPTVTSATGANAHVNPRERSSSDVVLAAARTARAPARPETSSVSPAVWNDGNSVATPSRWETTPPSWSTPITAGKSRPLAATASETARVVAR